jgi:hypothetical protein
MLDAIKSYQNELKVSFSQFSQYKTCGWRYYIEKIAKVGIDDKSIFLYFGASFHFTVQKILNNKSISIDQLKKDFKITFFKLMKDDNFVCSDDDFNLFCQQFYDIIENIPFETIFEEYNVIATELDFYQDIINKISFHGIIDFILQNKKTGRYIIGDWKTATKPWRDFKIKDEIFVSQLQFYKYFWCKKNNINFDEVDIEYWVVCREGKEKFIKVPIENNNQQMKFNVGDLKYSLQLIHFEHKFPKIKLRSSFKCRFCPYKDKKEYCDDEPFQILDVPKLMKIKESKYEELI